MKKIQYTIVLAVVSLLASLGVSSTYLLTKDRIREKELAARKQALYTVLPGLEGNPVEITPPGTAEEDIIYQGIDKDGEVIGYAAMGEAQGYASVIKIMVGIKPNLEEILGIDILAQNETPGLGSQMTEVESTTTLWSIISGKGQRVDEDNEFRTWKLPFFRDPERVEKFGPFEETNESKPRPWFQKQFEHKTYNQLVVSKVQEEGKITAITGATISSNAAVNAVKNAIEKIRNTVQPRNW